MGCENYAPGYFFMKNLNNETQNGWSLSHEDAMANGQFYNRDRPRKISEFTENETKMLKQTMLEHEAIFRKQSHIMADASTYPCLRAKMGCENYAPGYFFMKNLNNETQNGWSLSHEDAMANGQFYNRDRPRKISEFTENETKMLKQTMLEHEAIFRKQVYELHRVYTVQRYLMNELKKENQFTCSLQVQTSKSNPYSSHFSPNDTSKMPRMASKGRQCDETDISLEFPFDANINKKNIKERNLEEPTPSNIKTKFPSSMKLSRGTSGYLTYNGQNKAEVEFQKLEPHITIDLNEPVEQASDEEPVISSSDCQGMTSQHVETKISLPQGPWRDFSQDIHREEGASFHLLKIAQEERRRELPFFNSDGGMNFLHLSSWSNKKPAISEHKQHNLENYHKLSSLFSYEHDKEPQSRENPTVDREASERNPCFPSISYSRDEFPPCFSVSSWPNSAIQVPQHLSFTSSLDMQVGRSKESIQSSYNSNVKWKCQGDLFSRQNSRSETPLPFNGLHNDHNHGSSVPSNLEWPSILLDRPKHRNCDSSSYQMLGDFVSGVKHVKDLGLNIPFQNGSCDKFAWHNCTVIADSRGISGTSSVGIPWIKSNQYESVERHTDGAAERDKCLTSVLGRSWPVTTDAASHQVTDSAAKGKLSCTEKWISKDTSYLNICGFKNQIDLNNVAELPDETQSITKQVLSSPSAPSARKFVLDIDLEAPASSEAVDHMVQEEKCIGTNESRPVEIANSISSDHREIERQQEETIRLIAETLVSISYETCRRSVTGSSHPKNTMNSADPLMWFAETIVSNEGVEASAVGKSKEEEYINSDLDGGMDFYESMTLKLSDTKIEEHCIQQKRQDNENGEENGFASMLLTKGRKCQGKKRRQKRDFQKDILPALSSLSRHEVTEDLQSFGELMKDSGLSWRSCGTRRNGGNGQARRRQSGPRGASVVVHIPADPLPKKSNIVLDVDGSSILGWGRTRQCRRQRWPSGSIAGPLS